MSDDRFAVEEGGGGLDSFTGVITDAFFQEGEFGVSLKLVSTFDDPENYVRFEDGTFTQFYRCGKGWVTRDGGDTVEHESGDPGKRFNKASKAGQLVAQIGSIPGIGDALPADWSAYVAKSWKGMHLVWGRVPLERRKQVDGEWTSVTEQVLMPVGLAGAATPAASNGAGAVDLDSLGLTGEQISVLSTLAQTVDTDGKFLEGIVKVDGVMSNQKFMGAVSKNTAGLRKVLAEATF